MVVIKIFEPNFWSFRQNRGEFRLIYHPSNFIAFFFECRKKGRSMKWVKMENLMGLF